ncbi:MAG: IS110 family transposase, partial [Gemmatimonadota bacterium]
RVRVVLEVGIHSPWISRLLAERGHEVVVANPRKLRLIYENPRKTDRADAEYLARVGRMDPELLAPVTHGGRQAQADRGVLRARQRLVRIRGQLINQVRGAVKSWGERLPSCGAATFVKRVDEGIPEALRPALDPLLRQIGAISQEIKGFDEQIERLCEERYPETRLLRQVPGVGPKTSLGFILTVEDPDRFRRSRDVGPYLGLVPRQDDSGSRERRGGITKTGDEMCRRLLVQSAHYILGPFGPDCDLREWGKRIVERGEARGKKHAVVAVARKLAVLLHRLWVTGEIYEPLRAENAVTDREKTSTAMA